MLFRSIIDACRLDLGWAHSSEDVDRIVDRRSRVGIVAAILVAAMVTGLLINGIGFTGIMLTGLAILAASALSDAPFTSRRNLRSVTNRADYLVIHYDGFQTAADSLAAWRRFHLPLLATPAPHAVETIPVSAIFDQFSGGRTDPTAIRNFLRAVCNVT